MSERVLLEAMVVVTVVLALLVLGAWTGMIAFYRGVRAPNGARTWGIGIGENTFIGVVRTKDVSPEPEKHDHHHKRTI